MRRAAEILLFVVGVAVVGLGWPWGLFGFPLLVGWFFLWRAPPVR